MRRMTGRLEKPDQKGRNTYFLCNLSANVGIANLLEVTYETRLADRQEGGGPRELRGLAKLARDGITWSLFPKT